jgi:hypothetical protein
VDYGRYTRKEEEALSGHLTRLRLQHEENLDGSAASVSKLPTDQINELPMWELGAPVHPENSLLIPNVDDHDGCRPENLGPCNFTVHPNDPELSFFTNGP